MGYRRVLGGILCKHEHIGTYGLNGVKYPIKTNNGRGETIGVPLGSLGRVEEEV
jgi:hypothetical protein